MEVAWALLADGIAPRPDGKIDLFGVGVDVIYATAVPAIHARLSLAGRVVLTSDEADTEHRLDVTVRAPDGSVIGTGAGNIHAIAKEARPPDPTVPLGIGIGADFVNLGLIAYGRYRVELSLDGNPVPNPLTFSVTRPPAEA
jgi:hypothetical protein